MRCDECGVDEGYADRIGSTHCAPPFARQPHAFTGLHPADMAEAVQADLSKFAPPRKSLFVRLQLEREAKERASTYGEAVYPAEAMRRAAAHAREEAHAKRPLDTSTLGPVRIEPNVDAAKARVVREALLSLANFIDLEITADEAFAFQLAAQSSDYTLLKLRRLLS